MCVCGSGGGGGGDAEVLSYISDWEVQTRLFQFEINV